MNSKNLASWTCWKHPTKHLLLVGLLLVTGQGFAQRKPRMDVPGQDVPRINTPGRKLAPRLNPDSSLVPASVTVGTADYVPPVSGGTSDRVLSLDSILARIDRNNPLLKSYGSRAAAARAYAEGARGWMAPMVGVGTFMTPYPGQPIMEARDRGFAMISAEQDIPNPGKQRAARTFQQSKAGVEEAERGITLNRLRSEAKQLYFDWVVLEKQRVVLTENRRILQTMKKLADIRYPYQQGSLGNIYKAQGRLYELDNQLTMTDAAITSKRIGLNTLMHQPKTDDFRVNVALLPAEPTALVSTSEEVGSGRSDIRRVDQQILSMQAGIASQRALARPDFRIRMDHMAPLSKGIMPQQFTLMGMVSIPIVPWASRGYRAEIKGLRQDIEAMRYEREGMLNDVQGMVAQLLTDIQNLKGQLSNYERRIIPTLRRNYDTQLIAYEQNKGELPGVIDAWETLNMTQMDYLSRLQDYYRLIVNYEKELEK